MRFQAVGINEFAKHTIIYLLQSKAMIPHKGSLPQHSREALIPLGIIELIFVRNHTQR